MHVTTAYCTILCLRLLLCVILDLLDVNIIHILRESQWKASLLVSLIQNTCDGYGNSYVEYYDKVL